MNRPLLVTLAVALALAPSLAPAQVLMETMTERRARCNEALPLLPALEKQAAEYEAGAVQVVARLKASPNPILDAEAPSYVGQGARLLRLIEPTANGCAVAAPEVGAKFSALVEQVETTRIRVLSAMTGTEAP